MSETNEPPADSETPTTSAMAMVDEAEAEAAEAEALAAAARARARAARLRREALTATEDSEDSEYYEDYEDGALDYDYAEGSYEESSAHYDHREEAEPEPASRLHSLRQRLGLPLLPAIAKVAAILIICGLAGFSGFIVWNHHEATQRKERAEAFTTGAKVGVVNMISLDFNKAKEDVQRVIDSSTGQFRNDFQQRAADFTKVVEQSKLVTEGTVTATAVESMSEYSAVVLVSATSRVTNSAKSKNEPRVWRLRVTVTDEGGQYKMSKVEFVP